MAGESKGHPSNGCQSEADNERCQGGETYPQQNKNSGRGQAEGIEGRVSKEGSANRQNSKDVDRDDRAH